MLVGASVMMADGGSVVFRMPRALEQSGSKPRRIPLFMDVARQCMDVDKAAEGVPAGNEIIPFTGKGVAISIIDAGIDPRHIAFQEREDSSRSRVALYMLTRSALEDSIENKLSYRAWRPMTGEDVPVNLIDTACGGHGTHTSGTAGGAYMGNPFYGVAPDATLLLTSMGECLYDDEIMFAISSTLGYSRVLGMPCVASLSLGSTAGAHDGTGLLTDVLAEKMAEKGQIVCFAAGNDGSKKVSVRHDFDSDGAPMATALADHPTGCPAIRCYSQFYCDEPEMEVAFSIVQAGADNQGISKYEELWRSAYMPIQRIAEAGDEGLDLLKAVPKLSEYYDPKATLTATTAPAGCTRTGFALEANLMPLYEGSPYAIGVLIKAPRGHAEGYIDGESGAFRSYGLKDYKNGDSLESISDYCTSPYVIGVGAYNARRSYELADGTLQELAPYYGNYEEMGSYSSYGTLPEPLPQLAAPGTDIIAPIINASTAPQTVTSVTDAEGREWRWGPMTGTSMACPMMAGIVALWLQADPELTRDDVLEVAKHCSQVVEPEGRVAIGLPSAYDGLKYILEKKSTGIKGETGNNAPISLMVRYLGGSEVEAVLPYPTSGGRYTLIGMDGCILQTGAFVGPTFTLTLPDGVCILRAETSEGVAVQKLRR